MLGAVIFQSDLSFLYIRMVICHLCLASIATVMANVIEEMVGTREAEAAAVATESGGSVATESGGAVATESGGLRQPAMRRLVTIRRRTVG